MEEAKVILITGSSRGIGKVLALAAAGSGLSVVVNYLSGVGEAQAVVDEITQAGARAVAVQADVSTLDGAGRLVAATVEHFGRLDALVNNAGVGKIVGLDELDAEQFEQTLRVNLLSAFMVSQAAIPHMKARGGRLVFMSSGAARTGGRVSAAYAASKAGLEGLMHYYASYLRPHRITANAIAPSLIASDMTKQMDLPPPDKLPLGRLGRLEEVWPALRMILDTEYLTGQTIHLDAGRYPT